MGATYPDLYAAIGVHSGLAFGVADDLISAFAAMRQGGFECSSEFGEASAVFQDERTVPTIVFHGDRDAIVHPRNADSVIARSMKIKNWQKKVHRGQVPGGHAYTRTIHSDENGRAIFEQCASMEPDTLGRAAVLRVHTPIRVDPMRQEKC